MYVCRGHNYDYKVQQSIWHKTKNWLCVKLYVTNDSFDLLFEVAWSLLEVSWQEKTSAKKKRLWKWYYMVPSVFHAVVSILEICCSASQITLWLVYYESISLSVVAGEKSRILTIYIPLVYRTDRNDSQHQYRTSLRRLFAFQAVESLWRMCNSSLRNRTHK